MSDQKSWCWWSTHESVQKEVPSVTAILETIIAVPLYWWIALHTGLILPLLISAAVAPMVLLRSEQSVVLGVWLFRKLWRDQKKHMAVVLSREYSLIQLLNFRLLSVGFILPISVGIRIFTTLFYLGSGVHALPTNFRRLILCTSPAQLPELVPGLEERNGDYSVYKFSRLIRLVFAPPDEELETWLRRKKFILSSFPILTPVLSIMFIIVVFLPPWLYRITIKSTAWFWWPLAFLGGDLKRVQNPALFHWQVMGSLWAKTSIALAILSLVAFATANLVFDGTVFERNPLLTPVGYLLLIDWKLRLWQVCALSAAVLSILIVYLVNDVSGEYRIAQETGDGKLLQAATGKYGWIERVTRVRFLLLLGFWGLVGTHAFLYANSNRCWFSLPPALQGWAQDIYGDRLPRSDKCPQ